MTDKNTWPEFRGEQSYRDDLRFIVSASECFTQSFTCRSEGEVETVRRYAVRHPEVGRIAIIYDHDFQVWRVQHNMAKLEITRREGDDERDRHPKQTG